MAESDNESDFASAESDQEEQEGAGSENLQPTPEDAKQPDSVEVEGQDSDKDKTSLVSEVELPPTDSGATDQATEEQTESRDTKDKDVTTAKDEETIAQDKTEGVELKEEASVEATNQNETVPEQKQEAKEGAVSGEETKPSEGQASGWGWGSWGSIWTSVSTVTESAQAIGKKVTSVIASVEDTLGLPSPEELAQREEEDVDEETKRLADEIVEHDVPEKDLEPIVEEPHHVPATSATAGGDDVESQEEQEKQVEPKPESEPTMSAVSGFFSGFASVGKELMSGGLDALETLGKKTMEVLTEGDPGLRNKRSAIGVGESSPTLSQLLQEAKATSETASQSQEGAENTPPPLNYSRLFDEYQGVVHLEALELLSKECETKVRSGMTEVGGEELQSLKTKIAEVIEAFQVEEEPDALDDDSSQLHEVLEIFSDITLPLKVDKLIKVSNSWREKLEQPSCKSTDGEEGPAESANDDQSKEEDESEAVLRSKCKTFYEDGLRSLAELTSASIELFRKMAEVSLLPDAVTRSNPLEQAKKFNRLTVLVSSELDSLASVHAEAITGLNLNDTNSSVTSLYLESSNSGSYVQDAFQLLIPVLKFTLVQQTLSDEPPTNVMSRN